MRKGKGGGSLCKPYCGLAPVMHRTGVCLNIGVKAPKSRFPASLSITPMHRNSSRDVLKFSLGNPNVVRGDFLHYERVRVYALMDITRARWRAEAAELREKVAAAKAKARALAIAAGKPPPVEAGGGGHARKSRKKK